MTRPLALVFDLDGTLVDSVVDIAAALNHALQRAGRRPVTLDETRGMVGEGVTVLVARALARTGDGPADPRAVLAELLDHYTRSPAASTRPYPGVPETLARLQERGHAMAVCTNKPLLLTRQVLACLGLDRHFPVVIGGDSLPQRKPDPAPALAALSGLGARPDEALFVGDSATDVATARAAGMRVVGVTWGYARGQPLEADWLLDRFPDLLALIHEAP